MTTARAQLPRLGSATAEQSSRRKFVGTWAGLWVMAALIPLVSSEPSNLLRYEDLLIDLLVVLGLNMQFGYAGEFSLGQPVMAGLAAYTAGVLSSVFDLSAFV